MSNDVEDLPPREDKLVYVSGQSMQIASVYTNNVLEHLFGLQNVEVCWGTTDENLPVFQIKFDHNSRDKERFENFLKALSHIKTQAEYTIDQNNDAYYLVTRNLDSVAVFWRDFISALSLPPAILSTEPPSDDDFKITPRDVLKLREDFYLSREQCAEQIAFYNNNKGLQPLGKFVYQIDDLERSIALDKYIGLGQTNYLPENVFHIH